MTMKAIEYDVTETLNGEPRRVDFTLQHPEMGEVIGSFVIPTTEEYDNRCADDDFIIENHNDWDDDLEKVVIDGYHSQFGVHNPTLTTKYANQFGARGYKVEDSSWINDLTDSLIINGSYHIHIPNAEVTNSDEEQFSHFVVSPYDGELGETDGTNFKVIHTFDEVVCYLENPHRKFKCDGMLWDDGDIPKCSYCKKDFDTAQSLHETPYSGELCCDDAKCRERLLESCLMSEVEEQ